MVYDPDGPAWRIMSFNLRCIVADAGPDDPDHWPTRVPAITQVLAERRPDLLGVQEATLAHLDVVVDALQGATGARHDVLGTGREGGSHGEYAAIIVRRDRFAVEEWDQFWLSDTPEVVGSRGWGCATPRTVTWARLRDLGTGQQLVHANTHFDWVDETVRRHSGRLMAERLAPWTRDGVPVVATGDFNCDPLVSPVQQQVCADAGLHDLCLEAGADPRVPTSQWYGHPEQEHARIDWILGSHQLRGVHAEVVTDMPGGVYPSDHWPVEVLVRVA